MFHILRQNNADLLWEIIKLKEILYNSRKTFPDELTPYYNWVIVLKNGPTSRHRNPATVMKYIRDADAFSDHAGERFL